MLRIKVTLLCEFNCLRCGQHFSSSVGSLKPGFSQLVDRHRRKAYAGGQLYNIQRDDLLDMMKRYDVNMIER